jgi:DNA polymerase III delta subunit
MNEETYHKNIFGEVVDFTVKEEEEEKLPLDKKGNEFNIFSLTDAIASRNKKDAWILYHKALSAGVVAEEIFWKVVWQMKTLLLALRTNSADEAGMKPYPYTKAKSALKNFKPNELETISTNLVKGYHEIRRGKGEMETFIEKLLLKL